MIREIWKFLKEKWYGSADVTTIVPTANLTLLASQLENATRNDFRIIRHMNIIIYHLIMTKDTI